MVSLFEELIDRGLILSFAEGRRYLVQGMIKVNGVVPKLPDVMYPAGSLGHIMLQTGDKIEFGLKNKQQFIVEE